MPNGQHDPSPAEVAGSEFPDLKRTVETLLQRVEALERRQAQLEERIRSQRLASLPV